MPTLEINIKMENRKALYTKYYLSAEERRAIIIDCGDAAALLLEYYIRLAAVGDKEITDNGAANYFGWTVDKVRRVRRQLTTHGWFAQKRYRIDHNTRGVSYYIGAFAKALDPETQETDPTEQSPAVPVTALFKQLKDR